MAPTTARTAAPSSIPVSSLRSKIDKKKREAAKACVTSGNIYDLQRLLSDDDAHTMMVIDPQDPPYPQWPEVVDMWGGISSAEFIQVAYRDVRLRPILFCGARDDGGQKTPLDIARKSESTAFLNLRRVVVDSTARLMYLGTTSTTSPLHRLPEDLTRMIMDKFVDKYGLVRKAHS